MRPQAVLQKNIPCKIRAINAEGNQLPGVADLLRRQFWFASEFHTPALRGLYPGTGAFDDEASFKFG
jgi:hypothetical protein